MATSPENWTHESGYRLRSDGAIKYHHDSKGLTAVVESIDDEDSMRFYTAVFGEQGETVESHTYFEDKESAQSHLTNLMEKHA